MASALSACDLAAWRILDFAFIANAASLDISVDKIVIEIVSVLVVTSGTVGYFVVREIRKARETLLTAVGDAFEDIEKEFEAARLKHAPIGAAAQSAAYAVCETCHITVARYQNMSGKIVCANCSEGNK